MHPLAIAARFATGAATVTRMTLPGIIVSAVAYGVWRYAIKPELNKYGKNSDEGKPEKKAH